MATTSVFPLPSKSTEVNCETVAGRSVRQSSCPFNEFSARRYDPFATATTEIEPKSNILIAWPSARDGDDPDLFTGADQRPSPVRASNAKTFPPGSSVIRMPVWPVPETTPLGTNERPVTARQPCENILCAIG